MDKHGETEREKESMGLLLDRQVSRRQFLKWAGLAGAAVAVGGGVGGLFAGCEGGSTTTTTSANNGTVVSTATTTSTLPAGLTPKPGGVMTIINPPIGGVIGWPADPSASSASSVVQTCLETLLHQDSKGNLVPWLAESYTLDDNLSSMTLKLRKGVKFHDGSDFNAEAAKWNLEQYMTPAGGAAPPAGAPPADGAAPPAGAPPAGAAPPAGETLPAGAPPAGAAPPAGGAPPAGMGGAQPNWGSVDLVDDYTIRLNFVASPGKPMSSEDWINTLPGTLADSFNAVFMVSKAAYDKNGLDWVKANPVGTGPFKFESYSLDSAFKVVKNPDYWEKSKPYLDGITFIFMVDPTTQEMTMQAGEADMTTAQAGKLTDDYRKMGMNVEVLLNLTEVLIPDSANPSSPWSKKEVREAAEYSIDREAIAKTFGYGDWQAPYQIAPRATTAYDANSSVGRKYDPEKAKQLLTQADYANGFDTTLIVFPEPAIKDISLAVQNDLAKVGIRAQLEYPDIGKYNTYMFSGTMPTNSVLFQGLPMIDASYMGGLQFMFNSIGPSWARPAGIEAKLKAAQVVPTPDVTAVRAVTDVLTQEAALIPINELGTGLVTQPYVVATFDERGNAAIYFNTQDFWLNK